MRSNQQALEELRWKKFPVLDDGFVCLVDCMGDDGDVCQAARVSYGDGTRKLSDDRTLLRYLMRHRHTTPFEMAELKFLIRMPMDAWRQHIRHRTSSTNEYSTRYSVAIDSAQRTPPDQWRLQAAQNRQGSDGHVIEWPEGYNVDRYRNNYGTPGNYLSVLEKDLQEWVRDNYEERLKFGVAREQARKDLPLSTYTEAYWKIDLHNLFHYLGLRMDKHAQLEIRSYANVMGREIVAQLFPLAWEAFEDYRLNAVTLTGPEVEFLRRLLEELEAERGGRMAVTATDFLDAQPDEWKLLQRCRERDECLEKFKHLGLVPGDLRPEAVSPALLAELKDRLEHDPVVS